MMASNDIIVGAVLAGGGGRRIGGRKAHIDLAGAPLIAHAARALQGRGKIAVVGDAEAAGLIGAIALADSPSVARGPLAGVHAALAWAASERADWLALCPCDTPFLPDDLVARLHAAAFREKAPLACAHGEDGAHPLISLWRVTLAPAVDAALGGARHPPLRQLVASLGAAKLTLTASQLANINAQTDLAEARARLSSGA